MIEAFTAMTFSIGMLVGIKIWGKQCIVHTTVTICFTRGLEDND